jgi:ribosomal protein S12 methylthiotransferase accessory factor
VQKLDEDADVTHYTQTLESLYGAETLRQANALLDGELRFFGQPSLGLDLASCDMHQRLLTAYGKLHL